MSERRQIPDPGFAGDTGAADPALGAALAGFAADPGRQLDVFAALQGARVLVPVLAVLGEAEADASGLVHDKTSDMATALLTGQDGRRALLAFTSLDALAAWRPDARPVPVTASLAARSAAAEGAAALVIDVAGPTTYVVEGELLDGLARGWTLARTGSGLAWVEPAPPGSSRG
ncbi:MAG TPA: SseB family protein [Nocardioides sp.]|uniref:SseB family protein n=1 Tax=Nocardioides sp. TaxID=35761 RepID=UPI002E34A271|nr:SseB family protein [Nocardioides sp.]HEX3932056.1 SseB family protein [Nocardioides sp.]